MKKFLLPFAFAAALGTAACSKDTQRQETSLPVASPADSSVFYHEAGLDHLKDGQWSLALEDFVTASKHNHANMSPQAMQGFVLYQQGRFDEAIPALERTIALNDSLGLHFDLDPNADADRIRVMLGESYLKTGQATEALTEALRAYHFHPSSHATHELLDQTIDSIVSGGIGTSYDFARAEAIDEYMNVTAGEGDQTRALELYASVYPSAESFELYGAALLDLGRASEAYQLLDPHISTFKDHAGFVFTYGQACVDAGSNPPEGYDSIPELIEKGKTLMDYANNMRPERRFLSQTEASEVNK